MEVLNGMCDRKVIGGKMFRVRLTLEVQSGSARIRDLLLLGDFFIHPEEALEDLEGTIRDAYNGGSGIDEAVRGFLDREGTVIYGGGPEDISSAVGDAVADALSRR